MKVPSSYITLSLLLAIATVQGRAQSARTGAETVVLQQLSSISGPQTAPAAQTSTATGQANPTTTPAPAATPTPAPTTPLAAPEQVPGIVETAARMTAQTIANRRKKKTDPEGYFGLQSDKIALFAMAAAVDPAQAKAVPYAAPYIKAAETQRTDKQVGASSSSSGSTSATDKPGIPYLLGLAIEHGAIAQNINGSTLTLSSSPYALIAAFTHQDTAQTYHDYNGFTRFAVAASYNLQNQNDPLASVSRKQLSEWSVKFRVLGDHSARSEAAHDLFVSKVLPALQAKANITAKALNDAFPAEWPKVTREFARETDLQIRAYLSDPSHNGDSDLVAEDTITQIIVEGVKKHLYSKIDAIGLTAEQKTKILKFLVDYKSATDDYVHSAEALDAALKALSQKPTLTLGYFNERGSGTPNYSVGKLMFEKKPEGFLQIDANLSVSAYGNPDRTKNQQTFRDATAALQLQQNLGRSPFLFNPDDKNPISLSFAGRYQRLQENRHVPGKKADIAVANWKIEIPVAPGVSLPISITYANATELIKEQDVRGNFGITFDLDKLKTLTSAK